MNRRSLALILAGVVLVATGIGVVAATSDDSSYNTSESELLNGSRTNMPVSGSGDDAVVEYVKPDVSESTNSEFSNGSLFGSLAVANDAVEYDGLVVGAQHDTSTELSNGSLTNLTTSGSGSDAYLKLTGDVIFSDSFEGESADSGYPDAWEDAGIDTTAESVSVSTTQASDGSQSFAFEDTDAGSDYARPSTQPYDTPKTAVVSGNIYSDTATDAQLRLYESGTRVIVAGMHNGNLTYYDGSYNTIATAPDNGEFVDITIKSIDPSTDTYTVTWSDSQGNSGTESGLQMENAMADGYTTTTVEVFEGLAYFDDIQLGKESPSSAQYVSSNLSVSDAEKAAINISNISNSSATLNVEYHDGSAWQTANSTSVTTASNHSLSLPTVSSSTWRVNVTVNKTDPDPVFNIGDDSILSTKQGTYTTQTYDITEVSGASLDASLPNATVTIDWQASADGSTWVTQTTTSYSSTGTHSASFSGDYEYWRANMTYTYDGGDGAGALNSLTWDATTAGIYQGQTHDISNASHAFLALTNKDATTEVTVEGYDNSTDTWEVAGNQTYTSSVFSSFALNGSYAKYRTNLSVTSPGASTVELHSEGVTVGTTVVEETTTTAGEEITLTTAISEPKAASNSLISDLPLDLLPTYLGADISATIKSWFASVFGGGASEANAQEEASQLQSTYNDNANDYTSWVNSQTADQDLNLSAYDTVKVTLSVNGENATRYVIGLVDNDRFATTTVVNETNRTVDETLVLQGQAAVDADTTLDTIHKEFVLEDKPISRKYQTRLSARYGSQFDGTLLNASA